MAQFLNLLTGEEAWAVFTAHFKPVVLTERIRVADAQAVRWQRMRQRRTICPVCPQHRR